MSEWLTTGEMIDRLKVGEIAEGTAEYEVTRTNKGIVFSDGVPLYVNSFALDIKWRILPNYVSFEKAMQAIKNGRNVVFHDKETERKIYTHAYQHFSIFFEEYNWNDLLTGDWTIEGDN
ncbi:hypothetical protein GCM10011409_21360 [Lentibacillus populi]|uniref:Uncharacterized protein n=1 Tax=Lentibacillus populi TaxID=1827502 RepID=A0A9W5TXM1_9BACI|nr:hypothetical protein [Lentibacillus populi]GGB43472.1 hypothetical protein GCM10011409_21360 [Lentibacillus populi]